MEFHPIANSFPLLEGRQFEELVADVKANGVREPIALLDGKILDGRNRWRAAQKAGRPCPHYEFGRGDPIAFVVSTNLHRRHLTEAQRAMAAAELCNISRGGDRKSEKIKAAKTSLIGSRQAAEMLGVHSETVKSARTVLDRGTPAEIDAVKAGRAGVRTTANKIRDRERGNGTPRKERRDVTARAVREFTQAVQKVERMCSSFLELKIPKLNDDERKAARKSISAARHALSQALSNL